MLLLKFYVQHFFSKNILLITFFMINKIHVFEWFKKCNDEWWTICFTRASNLFKILTWNDLFLKHNFFLAFHYGN